MKVSLTRYTADPLIAIEEAAANCYASKPNENGKIAEACYDSGHHSVLEFTTFTFHIEGISRACLAQLCRSRIASYAVESQRYTDQSNAKIIAPPSIAKNKDAMEVFESVHALIHRAYESLLALDIPKEDARYVLSNANTTTLEFSINLRSLIHLCNLRLCTRAQWEIRALVKRMRDEVVKVLPMASRMLVPQCEVNANYPFCTEKKSCGKHPKLEEVYKYVQ